MGGGIYSAHARCPEARPGRGQCVARAWPGRALCVHRVSSRELAHLERISRAVMQSQREFRLVRLDSDDLVQQDVVRPGEVVMVRWDGGAVVRWCGGAVVRRGGGVVGRWWCGSAVVRWRGGEGARQCKIQMHRLSVGP